MTNLVYGWRTQKTATGFNWVVYSMGYKIETVVLEMGNRPNRSQATAAAKRAVMKYRRPDGAKRAA